MNSWGADTTDALVRALEASNAPVVGAGAAAMDGDLQLETFPAGLTNRRFEIGSITKTMTATVLSWLVVGGEVAAENTLDTWLDVGGTPAARIKLSQLATHTSGLPRLAPNHASQSAAYDPNDPYASYGAQEAEAGLRALESLQFPGTRAYSNFGYQILGLCLERATARSLGDLFRTVLFEPLGMRTATMSDLADDVLVGTRDGDPVQPWRLRLAGPGGVVASLDDLLRYGLATAAPPKGRLGVAIEVATTCQLGWSQHPRGPIWHNGGTAGCRSMLAVSREDRRAVAAFVTDGGFDPVDAATMAALLGDDPKDAVPSPFDPVEAGPWVERAIEIATALFEGDVAAVRAAMDEQTAAALTTELLTSGRTTVIAPLLPLTTPSVDTVDRTGSTVHVHLRAESTVRTDRSITTTVMFDEDRRVVGLRIA
jgi:CubicO group peptidase (beta-lactamase class C family)